MLIEVDCGSIDMEYSFSI